jgi:hypothetical protein
MLTCGTMFFSIESWNSGGGGRSTARNRKGDTVDLMSARNRINIYRQRREGQLTSIYIKHGSLVFTCVSTNEDLLSLQLEFSLERRENNAFMS